jgi:hypothetical protein
VAFQQYLLIGLLGEDREDQVTVIHEEEEDKVVTLSENTGPGAAWCVVENVHEPYLSERYPSRLTAMLNLYFVYGVSLEIFFL